MRVDHVGFGAPSDVNLKAHLIILFLLGLLHAPAEHRDILLHQIASILFRAGGSTNREASIDVLRRSLKINDKEPLSYYTMGHNLVARGNLTGAVEFYR